MSHCYDEYFSDVRVACPYGLPQVAVFRQAMAAGAAPELLEFFLAAGYRRNGNYLYTMACESCAACRPIRLVPEELRPNRSQRRAWKRNGDVEARMGPLRITAEKLALCDRFLHTRFPGKGNAAIEYYAGFFVNSLGCTQEIEYRVDGRLLGVAVVDVMPGSVNCVYFYFDPDEARRSPGTFNILYICDWAKAHGLAHVYLGYLIREVAAMKYKARFRPHYLYTDGEWRCSDDRGGDGD